VKIIAFHQSPILLNKAFEVDENGFFILFCLKRLSFIYNKEKNTLFNKAFEIYENGYFILFCLKRLSFI
jgi:hypothetical protein